jgi:hypothetical protein
MYSTGTIVGNNYVLSIKFSAETAVTSHEEFRDEKSDVTGPRCLMLVGRHGCPGKRPIPADNAAEK